MLKTTPAVFAVGNTYQIMVEVCQEALMSVRVGEKIWYDETNGIMNSLSNLHRVIVPMAALDEALEYTVCIRPIIDRKPYFPTTEDPVEYSFPFRPVPESNIRIYHISDAHNRVQLPVAAAKVFGSIDLLILNGDILSHSGDPDKFSNVYEICAQLTAGSIPVIFSRGNHDMRGRYAERFADYTPSQDRRTYYTFRLGSVWGILLDCGEDKDDSCAEYGFMAACHHFRERQTDFIREVIENAQEEYAAAGVKTRLVISHNPFTTLHSVRKGLPKGCEFDIEEDIYRTWADLLKKHIQPDLMICGHTHKCSVYPVGGEFDYFGQPCPLVVGSEPQQDNFIGCGFVIDDDQIQVVFTDSQGNTSCQCITK